MINWTTVSLIGGFLLIVVAAGQLAKYFQKIKLPLITGCIVIGILAGPFVFKLIPIEARTELNFINHISLAFIAFAASAELYLKELRGRIHSIQWITFGQLAVTFLFSTIVVYLISELLPFTNGLDRNSRIAVSLLTGVIFVARSPASAIAIIKEMRARGPFTQTVIGVTVLKDFLVIILFSLVLSVSVTLTSDLGIRWGFLLVLIIELGLSFAFGLLQGRILSWILKFKLRQPIKAFLVIFTGYCAYLLAHQMEHYSLEWIGTAIKIEPLLVCIIGSFWITNYSNYRAEFIKILHDVDTPIFIAFFTLAGATLSLDIFIQLIGLAIIFFIIRLISIVIGAYVGGKLAGDPPLYNRIGWMPYVTQAGVGLGLATIVAISFPEWGLEFATLMIAVIVLNQIVGPPLFKWSINIVGEGHVKADTHVFDGIRDAIIFGFENQSIALSRQLMKNGWEVKIATFDHEVIESNYPDLVIEKISAIDEETLIRLEAKKSEAIVGLLTDDENYALCEIVYEKIGTKDVVVRLNDHKNFDKFHELGCLIVDPSTAIVGLMDHFVRSPQAATLLLGMQENQDSMDIEVQNTNLHGIALRDLRLPADLIVLSVTRSGHPLISHGYTRLRYGDYITVVGSKESLEDVALRFGAQ